MTCLQPELRVNPRTDTAFVALVDRLAHGLVGPAGSDDLQERLRATHPRATVRPRGLSGDSPEVWYVYRDGVWTDPER